MPKKSHRVASRQAAASKERKRKKKSQVDPKRNIPADESPIPSTEVMGETTATSSTMATTEPSPASQISKAAPAARQEAPRYRYVLSDLRKTSLIAGVMIIILIVLAFVLG